MNIPGGRWRTVLLRLLLLYLLTVAFGFLVGRVAAAVALTSSALFAWYLWNTYRLDRWARSPARRAPPEALGVWAGVFDLLHRNQRRQLSRRRTLAGIVQEVRQVTAALPDGVIFLDAHDRIAWINAGACTLLGLKKNQDLGRPLTNLLRDPALRGWLRQDSQADTRITIVSPVNPQLTVQLRMLSYGRTRRVLMARDVTDLKRTEAMRRDFIANASHELRTPLTVISGYLETLEDQGDPQGHPVVARMRQQAQRMQSIIEDLLTLSQLDSRRAPRDEHEIEVATTLQQLLAEAQVLSRGRQRIKLDIQTPLNIRADPQDLRSVLMNLIANAVSYTPPGGAIDIVWREGPNAALEFLVRDNGPGIAAQHIPRLTERFYRVATDRSRASGGTGLGLAIVKNVMSLHGGELLISSEPGRGSEFCCRFPTQRAIRQVSAAG